MDRICKSLFAGIATLAFALPVAALPMSGPELPSCGEGKEKKDEKKDPAAADAQCGGDKDKSKGEKKDPA